MHHSLGLERLRALQTVGGGLGAEFENAQEGAKCCHSLCHFVFLAKLPKQADQINLPWSQSQRTRLPQYAN